MNRNHLILLSILVLGSALRLQGIGFGLPFILHNDESLIVNYALSYGRGCLNPPFFYLPPLLSYLLLFFYGVFYLVGLVLGEFQNINDFALLFLNDPTSFYLMGRILVGFLPGVISIYLVYVLARKCFSELTGILSAFFLSVNFLHVRDSHYIYGDIPLVMVILMYLIVLYDLFKYESERLYAYAGILLGVGVSVKYNGAFLAVPTSLVIAANLLFYKRHSLLVLGKKIVIFFGCLLLSLFLTNPFMFLDYKRFLHDFNDMALFSPGFWFHLNVSILGSMGVLMILASSMGMVLAVARKKIFPVVLMAYCCLYYVLLTVSSQPSPRYILPILPILLMFAAYFTDSVISGFNKIKAKKIFGTIFVVMLVSYPCLKVYYVNSLFAKEDTRVRAYRWIIDNIPSGSVIAVDATGPAQPGLRKTKQQIKDDLETYTNRKFAATEGAFESFGYKIGLMLEDPEWDKNAYRLHYLQSQKGRNIFFGEYPEMYPNIFYLKEAGVEYVVISTMLEAPDKYEAFLKDLEFESVMVQRITPYKHQKMKLDYSPTKEPAAAFDLRELMYRERFGPSFEIYRITEKDM